MTNLALPAAPAVPVALPFTIAPPLPHIREYSEADAEALAQMWRGSARAWPSGGPGGGEDATAARVRQEQRERSAIATFLAFAMEPDLSASHSGGHSAGSRHGPVVGYCSLLEYPSEASTAYVGLLSVHPAWHGQGVGRDLLKAALVRTVSLKYDRLDLGTWAGNLKAVPLYKKTGFFWVPDTSVHMENYLPLLFRLAPVQAFFQDADWYRDFTRDLSVKPDDEKRGQTEVYTYSWEHNGKRLQAAIDRHSKGLVALETEAFSLSTGVDDPRLPVGGQRRVHWQVENRRPQPLSVTLLAEGEDTVRCAFQVSASVQRSQEWVAPVTAEQPQAPPVFGRPANRVRSTVVLDGEPVPLSLSTRVCQPVSVAFDHQRWLTPGVSRPNWVTVENVLDEPVRGTVRLSASAGLQIDRAVFHFDLPARRRTSWKVVLNAAEAGTYALRGLGTVTVLPTEGVHGSPVEALSNLRTKVFEQQVHCGGLGEIFVDQTEEQVVLSTDRLVLRASLRPGGWSIRFDVADRESGKQLLQHDCALGPPFWPSVFAASTWTARIERQAGSATLLLSTTPATLPGLTFERVIQLSASGLIRVTYRATNASEVERSLVVSADTSAALEMAGATQVAAPLATGLVLDDALRFPDWENPDQVQPDRYAENWIAECGDGWVAATLWERAQEVAASGWDLPSLKLDLGTVPPGGQVEAAPVYLYAGQGDWRTARALWRQLLAPEAPQRDPAPRAAHAVRLERFIFDDTSIETRLLLVSERARRLTGKIGLEAPGIAENGGPVSGVRTGAGASLIVRGTLPERAQAVAATLVLDHERATERSEAALIQAGGGRAAVSLNVERDGDLERVWLDNGRLRLGLAPAKLGRVFELSVPNAAGEWVNQLHASFPESSAFVWFNPWFGGIHPVLYAGERSGYPGALLRETFDWREAACTGAQGIRWQGVAVSCEMQSAGMGGLKLEVSYLTIGASNLLAVVTRLENHSGARLSGELALDTFLQPGGDRTTALLHYDRYGVRNQKRVHGGWSTASGQWCTVTAASGTPALTLICATPQGRISARDLGLEGPHPSTIFPISLAPDEALEGVAYLVVADDLVQARLYRFLSDAGGLA